MAFIDCDTSIDSMLLPITHRRYQVLRKHLRSLRNAAGLTQAELATRLKVDQSYISKVERGERYVDMLFYLDWCRACKSPIETAVAQLTNAGA
jgi:transcriptional regulator with XRE-family HTH domain